MPLDIKDKEILRSQSCSKTAKEWYYFFNEAYTEKQIRDFCYHNNLKIKKMSQSEKSKIQSQNARKWNINQDYFKTWSHNMAYILGLWYADGCIYRGKIFDITLHKKDKYILKQIAKELQYEGPIIDYVDRQAARINFSCVEIYKDLINLGGKECKSLDITFPKEVPSEYMPDFIRGYFDGDGCIMKLKNNRINSAFTCGSKAFIDDLWKFLKENVGVHGGSYDASCVSLKFGKKDTLLIGQYMYQNNPELYLKRKYDKFFN